jgi:hypothetical protein
MSDANWKDLKATFLEAYDENCDGKFYKKKIKSYEIRRIFIFVLKGKISVNELADILPVEENFLLLFRRDNPLDSSVEFMKVK